MNEMMEANLNAKAIEKIKLAKNPEMVLLIYNCCWVRGRGWFDTLIVTVLPS